MLGVSKPTVDRVVDEQGPRLALIQWQLFRKGTVLTVEGTLVPTRGHTLAQRSKNYRYPTNHQMVIDADTYRFVVVGRPLPGNRNAPPQGPEPWSLRRRRAERTICAPLASSAQTSTQARSR